MAWTVDDEYLRQIAKHPDDDGPRLLYADALSDSGDPADAACAEFIRI